MSVEALVVVEIGATEPKKEKVIIHRTRNQSTSFTCSRQQKLHTPANRANVVTLDGNSMMVEGGFLHSNLQGSSACAKKHSHVHC